jgi:predicted TIM-barrel fold metal-dependent hydrolase
VALAAWKGDLVQRDPIARRFNELMGDWQRTNPERLRGVGILTMDDVKRSQQQIRMARNLGLRAMLVPCSVPPGGVSPGGMEWRPVWREMADAGMTVVLHAGSEQGFVDQAWSPSDCMPSPIDAEAQLKRKIDVATVDMFKLVSLHYGPQVFLSSLLLGGVFSEFRDLTVAVVELGAGWVAPYLAMLDARSREFGPLMGHTRDARSPSDVFVDQVRVTPYHWEPVEQLLADPKLHRLYAFSTDFPHSEGGHQTLAVAESRLSSLPKAVRDGYFSGNASLILN